MPQRLRAHHRRAPRRRPRRHLLHTLLMMMLLLLEYLHLTRLQLLLRLLPGKAVRLLGRQRNMGSCQPMQPSNSSISSRCR